MTGSTPEPIQATSILNAWMSAVNAAMAVANHAMPPLVISIRGGAQSLPADSDRQVAMIDAFLENEGIRRGSFIASTAQSALTIFPYQLWIRRGKPSAACFCKLCVTQLYPRMKKINSLNKYGTYFQRMMGYPIPSSTKGETVGQLEHVIDLMAVTNYRYKESSLQMPVFHPMLDHTNQRRRGFPCLQQVGVSWTGDGFALNAFYPTQYLVDRGLGNYIGLTHLGMFMAHESGRAFVQLNIYVGSPTIAPARKSDVKALLTSMNEAKDAAANGEKPEENDGD
ncbi:MAG: hypothetical protein KDA31_06370 [Phycisphaerales bacterium]|nr:hypothetical protein [Phycisphaerales bacterium]